MDQTTQTTSTSTHPIADTNNSEDLNSYFGFDVQEKLRNMIVELDIIGFKILVNPKASPFNKNPLYSIEFAMEKQDKPQPKTSENLNETKNDDLDALLDHIEFLQKSYDQVMAQVKDKIKDLQVQYKKEDYQIILIKRRPAQTKPEPDKSGKPNDENLSESTVILSKRKWNFINPNTPHSEKQMSTEDFPKISNKSPEFLIIGPNGTEVSRKDFDNISWSNHTGATRKLCELIFGDRVLASHSLTGNPSPAFQGRARPKKGRLDTQKTEDIIYLVCDKFNVSQQLVRSTITTKCADSTKKFNRLAAKFGFI